MDLVLSGGAHHADVVRAQGQRNRLDVVSCHSALVVAKLGRMFNEPVRHAARRERLERGFEELPPLAQVAGQVEQILVRLGAVAVQKAKRALEDLRCTDHAGLRERGAHKCVVHRKARVQPLVPAPVFEILHRPCRLGAGEAECVLDGPDGEPLQDRDGRHRAEDPRRRRVVEAARVCLVPQLLPQAARHLVADGDGDEEPIDVGLGSEELCLRQARRNRSHAGVQRALGVRVVEVQRMAQRRVQQTRVLRRERLPQPQHRRRPGLATQRFDRVADRHCRVRAVACRQRDGDEVDEIFLEPLANLVRQEPWACICDESGEYACHGNFRCVDNAIL